MVKLAFFPLQPQTHSWVNYGHLHPSAAEQGWKRAALFPQSSPVSHLTSLYIIRQMVGGLNTTVAGSRCNNELRWPGILLCFVDRSYITSFWILVLKTTDHYLHFLIRTKERTIVVPV